MRQLTPELPRPGYPRRAQGFSPSPRLDGAPCVPGLFHPGAAHGVPPFRACAPCRAVAPLGARCPPDVCLSPPAPDRSPARAVTSTACDQPPTPLGTGGQAPQPGWGAGPSRSHSASTARPSRTAPRGATPFDPGLLLSSGIEVPDRRTTAGSPSGLSSLCKELGTLGRLLGRARGRCPPGLLLSRARSRAAGVGPSRPPAPLGLRPPYPWLSHGPTAGPSGVLPPSRLGAPLARRAGPHEVLHLVIRLVIRSRGCPWLPPMVPAGPCEPAVHPLSLEPRVASPLPWQALFGTVRRELACTSRDRVSR